VKNRRDPLNGIDLVFQLSVLLIVTTVGPLVLGIWIDRAANTSPLATLCLVILGVLGGTVLIYRIIQDAYKRIGGQNQ